MGQSGNGTIFIGDKGKMMCAGWGGPRDKNGDRLQPKPGELAAHVRSAFA